VVSAIDWLTTITLINFEFAVSSRKNFFWLCFLQMSVLTSGRQPWIGFTPFALDEQWSDTYTLFWNYALLLTLHLSRNFLQLMAVSLCGEPGVSLQLPLVPAFCPWFLAFAVG